MLVSRNDWTTLWHTLCRTSSYFGLFTRRIYMDNQQIPDRMDIGDIKTGELIRINFQQQRPRKNEPYTRLKFREKPRGLFTHTAVFLLLSRSQLGISRDVLKIILEMSRSGRNAVCWILDMTNKRKR